MLGRRSGFWFEQGLGGFAFLVAAFQSAELFLQQKNGQVISFAHFSHVSQLSHFSFRPVLGGLLSLDSVYFFEIPEPDEFATETQVDCRVNLKLVTGKLVLVYQMPKTASQTVERTLKEAALPAPVFRFHYLTAARAKKLRALADRTSDITWRQNMSEQLELMAHFRKVLRLRRFLCACRFPLPRIQVIAAVREVIETCLSSIFENHAMFVPQLEMLTADWCRKMFCSRPGMTREVQEWFDDEIKRHIGVDVYSKPFPWTQGYQVYANGFAQLLVFRFDFISQLAPVLSEFTGARINALTSQNLSNSKAYVHQYRAVKDSLRLPGRFVRAQLNGRFMRHFYSEEELSEFWAKWSDPLASDETWSGWGASAGILKSPEIRATPNG